MRQLGESGSSDRWYSSGRCESPVKVWWGWGVTVLLTSIALLFMAESLRLAGHGGWANALDVARLVAYWWWLRMAWACASRISRSFWQAVVKSALALGLLISALA